MWFFRCQGTSPIFLHPLVQDHCGHPSSHFQLTCRTWQLIPLLSILGCLSPTAAGVWSLPTWSLPSPGAALSGLPCVWKHCGSSRVSEYGVFTWKPWLFAGFVVLTDSGDKLMAFEPPGVRLQLSQTSNADVAWPTGGICSRWFRCVQVCQKSEEALQLACVQGGCH